MEKSPLSYLGISETNPPDLSFAPTDPTSTDIQNCDIGDLRQNISTKNWFILSGKEGGAANWSKIATAPAGSVYFSAFLGADQQLLNTVNAYLGANALGTGTAVGVASYSFGGTSDGIYLDAPATGTYLVGVQIYLLMNTGSFNPADIMAFLVPSNISVGFTDSLDSLVPGFSSRTLCGSYVISCTAGQRIHFLMSQERNGSDADTTISKNFVRKESATPVPISYVWCTKIG